MLQLFNAFPHVVLTLNINWFLLLVRNCDFVSHKSYCKFLICYSYERVIWLPKELLPTGWESFCEGRWNLFIPQWSLTPLNWGRNNSVASGSIWDWLLDVVPKHIWSARPAERYSIAISYAWGLGVGPSVMLMSLSHFYSSKQPLTHTCVSNLNRIHWFTKLDLDGVFGLSWVPFLVWIDVCLHRSSVTQHTHQETENDEGMLAST